MGKVKTKPFHANARGVFRALMNGLDAMPVGVRMLKTEMAEDIAIVRKRGLWQEVEWTGEQQRAFDDYWLSVYGKKIPNWWHRLYQASSGRYAVDYIPERLYSTRIEPALNDFRYAWVLEDKSVLEALARDSGCVVPRTILVCSKGQYYDASRRPITRVAANALVAAESDIVAKPTVGSSSGQSILFSAQGDGLNLDALGTDYIVQSHINQHPAYSAINATSVNTIRVMTYIVDDAVFHTPTALRIGRNHKLVDNIHAGGLVIGVDEDGLLLDRAFELGYGDRAITYGQHPDSGVVFDGYELPAFTAVLNVAHALHGRFPHIGIISWDFAVDEQDNVVLIEVNIWGQSIWIPQMIHGKGAFGEHTKSVLAIIKKRER